MALVTAMAATARTAVNGHQNTACLAASGTLNTAEPAPLAAGRASEAFCAAAERSADDQLPLKHQVSIAANALDPLLFDEIEELADRAASIWRSIAEASFRGEAMTVAVHLRQARLVTFHVHELVKQFGGSSHEARAA